MQEAVLTTKDFMNISITVSIIVLSILFSIAIVHAILIMRDVRKVSKVTGDITEGINSILGAPLALIQQVTNAIAPQAEKTIKSWLKKKEN